MKILHTADIHIGEFPGPERGGINCRLQDTIDCMNYLADKAKEEKPDVVLISGDLFHRSKLWADEALYEVQAAIDWLSKLSETAPVCLLYGTPNHDNIEAFNTLRKALPEECEVYIFTQPEMKKIKTRSGIIQVCGLPGFDRGWFRAHNPGVSKEEENQVFTDELGKIVLALRAMCEPGVLSVLMAHYTVPGANLESGQTQLFSQAEPLLLPDILDAAGFDLVALGHIHKPQKILSCDNAYYSGAINALNFNDEGQERGFMIHKFSADGLLCASKFFNTPCREFATYRFTDTDIVGINTGELDSVANNWWGWNNGVKNKIVRILYTCSDEANKAFNKSLLEKRFYEDGAFWVSEISPEKILITANREELSEHSTPEDNLREYLLEKAYTDEKIIPIIEAARPIISEAAANNVIARLTGLFEPLEIEVKNYRNYVEEHFNFSDVNFCTINGANGSGKSSLFMDAILDCLYEEPREGDLTGWIRSAEDARSGSITFTFRIGDKVFRVSRSRAKSGNPNLSISEFVDGEWTSRTKKKARDTQDEIVNILAEQYIATRNESLKAHYSSIGALQKQAEQMKKTRDDIKKLQKQLQETTEKAVIYEELKKAFSQDGIPHNIICSIVPMLTAMANNILSQMTGGKMGMEFITEKILKSNAKKEVVTLDILIEEYGKGSLPYLSKSGGEKVKAALSAILSLAEIKSGRAGIQLGMLFIDEPPFLDGDGIQAYCDALETIRQRYPKLKIMAITHDPTMKARFPQSIDIVKTDNGSKVIIN